MTGKLCYPELHFKSDLNANVKVWAVIPDQFSSDFA